MHMDPLIPALVAAAFGIVVVALVMKALGQPHVVAYLLAGVVLGPEGLGVFTDLSTLARIGDVGVILLLFFVGMEVDLGRLATGWRTSVFGTVFQVLLSVGCVGVMGILLDWPIGRVVLLGFAISLSSTALVVSILRQRGELGTVAGSDALGILLVQDVALVPMMITIGMMGGDSPPAAQLVLQVLGGVAFVLLLAFLVRGGTVHLPFRRAVRADHELQVFGALLICFGFSLVTGLLALSAALGAFAAGLVVSAARETDWIKQSLEPFHVLLVAVFFVSVGMLIDLEHLRESWGVVLVLVVAALATNTLVNAGVLRLAGRPWGTAMYVGSLLSQVGELSFVLAAVGRQSGIITDFAYQTVIGMITGTLLLTPLWIGVLGRLRG